MTTEPEGVSAMSAELEPGCVCRIWCRSDMGGQMINGKKYPAPDHADGCPAQKRERFVRVEYGRTACVIEPHECDAMRGDLVADHYTFTDVFLTRDQFEQMEEFQGF